MEERAEHIQITDNVEYSWASFHDTVFMQQLTRILAPPSASIKTGLMKTTKKIAKLLEEKQRLHRVYLKNNSPANKAAFSNIRSMVQSRLRQMQDSWLSQKAEEIQHYADTKDMKRFYESIKVVYGPQRATPSPILGADGQTLLTE